MTSTSDLLTPNQMLSRRQLFDRLVELGYDMSWSLFTKLCAAGEGPPVVWWWGHVRLYTEPTGVEWARSRMRPGNLHKRKRAA